jgi:hypothetical protein
VPEAVWYVNQAAPLKFLPLFGQAILQRLRDKAIVGYSQYSGHNLTPPPTSDPETEEELEIFAGYTRVVANKVLQRGLPRGFTPPQPERGGLSTPPAQWVNELDDVQREFDPTIVQYFDSAAPFGNLAPLLVPQGMTSDDDAGFFFTSPPISPSDGFFPHTQNEPQEMQWADFLQTL